MWYTQGSFDDRNRQTELRCDFFDIGASLLEQPRLGSE